MLKILQARLQQYVNRELPDVQAGFRKVRGTRDQIANIHWIIEKAREFQKNIYFCFIDYAKAFDCVDHNKLWAILKEMRIPDHMTCLLRNLYTVRKQQLELDMEQQTGSKKEKAGQERTQRENKRKKAGLGKAESCVSMLSPWALAGRTVGSGAGMVLHGSYYG